MKSILKRAGEFFQNIEKKKLILIVTVAVIIIAAGIVGAVLLNQVKYTVLFSGLEASEAGAIKTVLDGKGVPSKVEGTSTILVPEDQADELRIQLASEGYPSTGLNYELFSGSSAIGSTDLERRTYLQYQLQENIRTALKHMDKVQDSIVMVNLASDSSFVVSDNQTEASAAVTLKLKNGQTLSNDEAKSIAEFVMKCVPDLKLENVSIVDSKMKSYDISGENESGSADSSTSRQDLTERMKETFSKQVRSVLEPAFGAGNVAVSVNLTLNFDKQTVNKIEFAPPVEGESEGLLRSSEEIYNTSGSAAATDNTSAGTDSNGSGTPAYVAGATPGTNSNSAKTYNYELNEIQTQIEKEQGSLENLSVAVLVNSKIDGADGNLEKVRNLVAKAIGVKSDYISIEMMPFVDSAGMTDAFDKSQQTADKLSQRDMIVRIVEVVVIVGAIVFVARLFLMKPKRQASQPIAVGAVTHAVGLTAAEVASGEKSAVDDYELSNLVLKRSSEAAKIEELMDRYPETVAQILRTWIAEDN